MVGIDEALRHAEAWIRNIDGVEGVAQGEVDGTVCITVYVSFDEAAEKIPAMFHGYKVVVEHTDEFTAQL
jgi:hypothetical protein